MRFECHLRFLRFVVIASIVCFLAGCGSDSSSFGSGALKGAGDGGLFIEKATNGVDADDPPGPTLALGDPVEWTYVVTNAGDTPLTDITVTDDQGVAVSCPTSALSPGESMTCTGSGFAVLGQYSNVGTATGHGPDGVPASGSDPSHYFGQGNPDIDIEKATNGVDADDPPGPMLTFGDSVEWTYFVTNMGDVELTDVTVTDDQGVAVSCPAGALSPGESMTCTGSGFAVPGQYANVGTATGRGPDGVTASDSDPSHYLCPTNPGIDIEKATNGLDADDPPGPMLTFGDPVEWTYVVTNVGDVELNNVAVADDQGVAVACPQSTLGPGESMTCTGSGTATEGQYENLGTATGAGADGAVVSDEDLSHYLVETPPGDQGCSLGYWKNHAGAWPATGLSPGESVESVFVEAAAYPDLASSTLLETLRFRGGPTMADKAALLLKQAVAALLNATHPGVSYPRTGSQVIDDVNAALAGADQHAMLELKDELDAANNLGCPLNGDEGDPDGQTKPKPRGRRHGRQ